MTAPPTSLVVLTGPTGIGKTSTAIDLARRFGMEIVGADSVQVYRYMDIGSAKPTAEERASVRHHLIDVADPDEPFDAARYRELASRAIASIHERGKRVLVAGGTGLYIKALLKGLFKAPPVSEEIRSRIKEAAARDGSEALHRRLKEVDPEAASRIHPNDAYRITRALEVYEQTGRPISFFQREHRFSSGPYRSIMIGLTVNRAILYERINRRVDMMMEQGLVDEVKKLLSMGYGFHLKSMQSIGYRHIGEFLAGRVALDETVEQLKQDTRNFSKRQYTWFRAQQELEWFQPDRMEPIHERVAGFFAESGGE
jgi:tRNA dimethylallyltransferase